MNVEISEKIIQDSKKIDIGIRKLQSRLTDVEPTISHLICYSYSLHILITIFLINLSLNLYKYLYFYFYSRSTVPSPGN